jgi:hypothetical protein
MFMTVAFSTSTLLIPSFNIALSRSACPAKLQRRRVVFRLKPAEILLFKCQKVTDAPLFPRNATNQPRTPISQEVELVKIALYFP